MIALRLLFVLVCVFALHSNATTLSRPALVKNKSKSNPDDQLLKHRLNKTATRHPVLASLLAALPQVPPLPVPRIGLSDGMKNGLASGLAAAVVKAILQPIDTIKTVQQAAKGGMGPLAATRQVISQRGILGLWSGIGITVIGSSPSVAVYFGVYSSIKAHLERAFPPQFKLLAVAISASCGNTLASVLRAPYEVLKQRIQAGDHSSALEALRYSLKHEGPFGMFSKGKLSSQIVRDVPYAIVTLVSYEVLQELARKARAKAILTSARKSDSKKKSSVSVGASTSTSASASASAKDSKKSKVGKLAPDYYRPVVRKVEKVKALATSAFKGVARSGTLDAVCGAVAGGLGSLMTTPMDVVKTRLMTGQDAKAGKYSTVIGAVVQMYKTEGLRCFFIGTIPRLAHKIPANALFFLCYEAFRKILGVV